MSWNKRNNRT